MKDNSIYNPKLNPLQRGLIQELVENIGRQNMLACCFFGSRKEEQLKFANKCVDRINEIVEELGLDD
jgi:ribosome assembly protein YihI (activator of Der GTPase)